MAKFDPSKLPEVPPGRALVTFGGHASAGLSGDEARELSSLRDIDIKSDNQRSRQRELELKLAKGQGVSSGLAIPEMPHRSGPTSKIYEEGDIARAFAETEGGTASPDKGPPSPPSPPPPPPRKLGPAGSPSYRYRMGHVPDVMPGGIGGGGGGASPPPDFPGPPDIPEYEGPDEIIPFHRTTTAARMKKEDEREERRRKRKEMRDERRLDEQEEREENLKRQFGDKWGGKLSRFANTTDMNQQQMGMLVGQATGMDSWAASIGGTNPLMIAAQVMKNKLGDIKEGLSSDRGGKQLAGLGGMMETGGMVSATPLLSVPGSFVKAIGAATDKIQEWSESLHKSNIQFAEFSAAMTGVKVRQEIRDIFFSKARGNARADTAEGLAQSTHKLKEALAPIEDAFANFKNYLLTKLNDWFVTIIEALKSILKFFGVDLRLTGGDDTSLGGMTHWARAAVAESERNYFDAHGRPRRFR